MPGQTRIDKWLWAARFFKTRSLATEAVAGGKVEINGDRVKPARAVQPGDHVRVRLGPYVHELVVRAIGERRGPASVAATLYEETPDSLAARQRLAEQMRLAAPVMRDEGGRPSKKQRRELDRWRRGDR